MSGLVLAWALAIAAVLPCVIGYALVLKAIDRYEPEPWWLLAVCFAWGAVVASLASRLTAGVSRLAFAAYVGADSGHELTMTLVLPLTEETTKGGFLLLLWILSVLWLRELDGPLDGAVYGGVIGLGYTLTDDVFELVSSAEVGGFSTMGVVFILRTLLGGLAHATFTALTGLGIGIACEARSIWIRLLAPIAGFGAALGLNLLHAALKYPGARWLGIGSAGLLHYALLFGMNLAFIALLYALAFRDRAIVMKGLSDEAGVLLHPKELSFMTDRAMLLPLWNTIKLLRSPGGYRSARRKQILLAKLAFMKRAKASGARVADLREEWLLRERILDLNGRGVFLGSARVR